MNAIINQKTNSSIYFIFLLSFIIHAFVFITLFFIPIKSLKNIEKKTTNSVYMQILSQPHNVPLSKNKIPQIQKTPEKPLPKKMIQKDSLSTKPAPKIQQFPLENSVNNSQISTSSTAKAETTDIAMQPVLEALVDKAARCQTPDLTITQDAANAGITSGKIILEVQISSSGKVIGVKILKGTGFKIDEEVIRLAEGMICSPAEKGGKSVAVIKRLQWLIQR